MLPGVVVVLLGRVLLVPVPVPVVGPSELEPVLLPVLVVPLVPVLLLPVVPLVDGVPSEPLPPVPVAVEGVPSVEPEFPELKDPLAFGVAGVVLP